ncbi:glutathione S-transferase family protein [Jannaschia seohaensis]|uniref:Glutathione S-transferase n=1 Tax=Jannaschia seohaensis TaxID=475081 RepID=A0A2Y9B6T1_9RHOB|nr:glutathione S-transferase family protein [Jannaschia seohaensis]PWJ10045.1 glutathione S-transferase [Jannaschia seohaensis]SSA51795.1 glutathione S-transferase [Jannaschia seohaensis]
MFTLYWEYMAGSIVAQATLEALDADYRMQYVDMGAGEHISADFLHLNPAGRIPALGLPDGTTIGETGAIVTLLGELHPTNPITPQPGEPDRGAFLFWLNVMTTAGYLTATRVGHPERFARDDSAIAQVKAQADNDYAAFFGLMDKAIAGDVFFLDRGLTALDFYVTMLSEWVGGREVLLKDLPRLHHLCAAVHETPEYRAALSTHKLPTLDATG